MMMFWNLTTINLEEREIMNAINSSLKFKTNEINQLLVT